MEWSQIVTDFAINNTVVGAPEKMGGKCSIECTGKNNTLIFEEGVEIHRVTVRFSGDGNTIVFQKKSRPCGLFMAAKGGHIVVGKRTRMNKLCWFQAEEGKKISIGDDCLFADIRVRTSDIHSILSTITGLRLNLANDVTIGNRIWIAEKAHIYKGVSIGDGSIVGAHAVVVKDLPSDCLAVGNPARVVKENVTWSRKMLGPEGDSSKIDPNARPA